MGNLDPHFRMASDQGSAEPSSVNSIPEYWCYSCQDYGYIEVFHPSTDALIGHRVCNCINTRVWKIYPGEDYIHTAECCKNSPPF